MNEALSWEALAAEIGTTRRSIQKWRKLPDAPQSRDPAAWRAWLRENARHCYSGRLNHPPAPVGESEEDEDFPRFRWFDRREEVLNLMFMLEAAFEAGELSLREYRRLGAETLKHAVAIGRAWAVWEDDDGKGYEKAWCENLTAAKGGERWRAK